MPAPRCAARRAGTSRAVVGAARQRRFAVRAATEAVTRPAPGLTARRALRAPPRRLSQHVRRHRSARTPDGARSPAAAPSATWSEPTRPDRVAPTPRTSERLQARPGWRCGRCCWVTADRWSPPRARTRRCSRTSRALTRRPELTPAGSLGPLRSRARLIQPSSARIRAEPMLIRRCGRADARSPRTLVAGSWPLCEYRAQSYTYQA